MTEPNSASPFRTPWACRLSIILLSIVATLHLILFIAGQPNSWSLWDTAFIIIVWFYYFVEHGLFHRDRMSRWIAMLLVTLYIFTIGKTLNYLVLAIANLLYLQPFWKTAWTSPPSSSSPDLPL